MLRVIATERLKERRASILVCDDNTGELYSLTVDVRDVPAVQVARVVEVDWTEAGEAVVFP